MKTKPDPRLQEMAQLERQEWAFAKRRMESKQSVLDKLLSEKVPAKLQGTLDMAFAKAFGLIFEKGTFIIEKSYNKDMRRKQFLIDRYAAEVMGDRRSLKKLRSKAGGKGTLNLALSGAAGIGMGIAGVGIPDIAVFTALMLKGLYEICLSYGYDYDSDAERQFILRLICAAVSHGEEFEKADSEINHIIYKGTVPKLDMAELTAKAARCLSGELLYMKFLQGIPFVGALGGAYDVVYMKNIMEYAELKYRRRFYRNESQQAKN